MRATLSTRSRARAERCSFSIARESSLRLPGASAQCFPISLTESPWFGFAALAICTARAFATRPRTAADDSAGPESPSSRRRGTSTCRSMRSSSGPEMRAR